MFLRDATAVAATLAIPLAMHEILEAAGEAQAIDRDSRSDDDVARDEKYWSRVRRAYHVHPTVVNFDHGWANPTTRAATDTLIRNARELETLPAEVLVHIWSTVTTTALRASLAAAMQVGVNEIAIVRNATEALATVLLGVPLRGGDEVICSRHDYYAMLDALDQRRARDGVVLRMVEPPVPAPSMQALEDLYASAMGPRTKLVLLTHPSNLTGQLLPVRRIADRAHALGAEVVVDGAQSLGLFEDPVRSLGCDYYGASAHKWLGTPVGLGVLWMRPELTGKVWPLVPGPVGEVGMKRFEWIGTAPEYVNAAAMPAIQWHTAVGASRKAARLRHLSTLVRARVRAAVPTAKFYAVDAPEMTCGLTSVEIPSVDPLRLQQQLRKEYGILVQDMTGIRHAPAIRAVRVSPNVYATQAEIDRFGWALASTVSALSA